MTGFMQWLAAGLLALICAAPAGAQPGDTAPATATAPAARHTLIEVFVREGCPHCAAAEVFLAQLQKEQPSLKIVIRDVLQEPAAMERLKELAQQHNAGGARVPAILVGGQLIIGYSPEASTDKLIRGALAGQKAAAQAASTCDAEDPDSLACPKGPTAAETSTPDGAAAAKSELESFSVTLFGRTISLADVGLPAFAVTIGLLDGFNPCSMWVLLLMISLLAPLNDRKRMVAIAGTFVLIQGIAYFMFMAAWLNLFLFIGLSRISQLVIAAIAIVAGLINLKDFFAFKWGGISLSIPERAKPGIYKRMREILLAKSLTAAIVGAVILAVLVQFVEFLCTSGFPALFTRILTLNDLTTWQYYGYLLLYIAAYMLDDVIILTIGVVLLSRHRLQEKEGRVLKFISGLVMVGLGVYLIFWA